MNKSLKNKETRCFQILLEIRNSLRAAVRESLESHFDLMGLEWKFIYSDGKTYRVRVEEVRSETE